MNMRLFPTTNKLHLIGQRVIFVKLYYLNKGEKMANLFEISELEDFFGDLTVKELTAIWQKGAVLGFSTQERFLLSCGAPWSSGDHEWLDQKDMMKADISIFEEFCDDDGNLLSEETPDPEDIRDVLLWRLARVIEAYDKEIERQSYL